MPIRKLGVLDNDTGSYKYNFVLAHIMAKSVFKDIEILDTPIEGLMAGSRTHLQNLDLRSIKCVACANKIRLSKVSAITNNIFARWHQGLETALLNHVASSEHSKVM